MSELYWMVSVVSHHKAGRFTDFYRSCGVSMVLETMGDGTAASEILDYFGLKATDKLVSFSVVTGEKWKEIKRGLRKQLEIDIPGKGIVFTVPLGSVGGKKTLLFLTDGQGFEKGEESTLKGTSHELLVVIANQGYSEMIMDAARSENAGGGTVLHAKGTGTKHAETFLGVSLAEEKEIILIVVKTKDKNPIMKAIMDKAGLGSEAHSVVFSLPVTDTAGMRMLEEDAEE